ncbi:MAG: signal recognition particle-docking protein FtsY [Candidatus Freyarchaeota archaeon]|nr:signal recognition particle-docking protein FtsY [Candidatus Jordarchaeia archaeon]
MFEKVREGVGKVIDKITVKELSEKELDGILWELQLVLLQNDVSLRVAEKITQSLKEKLVGGRVKRFSDVRGMVRATLREAVLDVLGSGGKIDLVKLVEEKRKTGEPFTMVFLGVNGTGKTLSVAKVARFLQKRGFSCVLAAADTFRAGSIEQLEKHAKALGVKCIKQSYRSDAAAVAWDAVEHARARHINAVLVDTAGRMQTDKNLLDEMKKIVRVVNPDLKVFVGDALTGNDAVEQAERFNEEVGIDGIILTKVDADVKGGAALSVTYATGKPIMFIGVGQSYDDLEKFDPEWFAERIV